MIEKIILVPFQKHAKKVIEFSPTVTTISGANNKGKSTIMRAMRFVALNSPSGKSVVPFDSPHAKVIVYCDGKKVGRKQGGKTNHYTISGRKKPLKSFGKGKVPSLVSDLLNLGPINFQKQIDLPFWFTKTPGQLAKALNAVVNLEIIDQTLAAIASEARRASADKELTQARLTEAQDQLAELSWFPEFALICESLLSLAERNAIALRKIEAIEILVEKCVSTRRARDRVLNARLLLKELLDTASKGIKLTKKITQLQKLITKIEKVEYAIQPIPNLTELIAEREKADSFSEKVSVLEGLITDIQDAEKTLCARQARLKATKLELKKKLAGRCPMCGGKAELSSLLPSATSTPLPMLPSLGKKKAKIGMPLKAGCSHN